MVALASPVWVVDDGEAFLLAVAASVPAWQRDALCVEYDGRDFFPERGGAAAALARARKVCQRCAVQQECLSYAVDLESTEGLSGTRGGTDNRERLRLLRRGIDGRLVREHGVHAVQGREAEADGAVFDWALDNFDFACSGTCIQVRGFAHGETLCE